MYYTSMFFSRRAEGTRTRICGRPIRSSNQERFSIELKKTVKKANNVDPNYPPPGTKKGNGPTSGHKVEGQTKRGATITNCPSKGKFG